MFKKILIANRGEIACRIARTCDEMGIATVAVFSEPDKRSAHVDVADEAVPLNGYESKESYLDIDKIITAAQATGAEAIHPGYGFLSENAAFSAACKKAGIVFIGPSPAVISAMGDKVGARKLARTSALPLVPGIEFSKKDSEKEIQNAAAEFAREHQYPIMIKAAGGGGGRGMRRVTQESELADALQSARREAEAFFNDGTVFVEKLVEQARHIEVQILGDQQGTVYAIHDRDCSLQRNHQKVIEEAPAPGLTDEIRSHMHADAVQICKEAGYVGAGTVEFLLDTEHRYYFLEVNSRLQVEHPVTEEISGLDLVACQIRIAAGEALTSILPDGVPAVDGASIEVRMCAEKPWQGFAAATGLVERFTISPPAVPAELRLDTGFREGDRISHYYDSLIAKVIVHAEDRPTAIRALTDVLEGLEFFGVDSNLEFLLMLCRTEAFHAATHSVDSIASFSNESRIEMLAQVSALSHIAEIVQREDSSPWTSSGPWGVGKRQLSEQLRSIHGVDVAFAITALTHESATVEFTEPISEQVQFETLTAEEDRLYASVGGRLLWCQLYHGLQSLWCASSLGSFRIDARARPLKDGLESGKAGDSILAAPLPGKIVEVKTSPGAAVNAGDALMVIESMKMEHVLTAPISGTVEEIMVRGGDVVEANAVLAKLEAA